MKKSLFILCTVLLLALLVACGTTNDILASEPASTTPPAEEIIPKETEVQETTPTSSTHEFDFETGTVILNNGVIMPILGIGTFSLSDSEAEESVYWALRDGYRLIDKQIAELEREIEQRKQSREYRSIADKIKANRGTINQRDRQLEKSRRRSRDMEI